MQLRSTYNGGIAEVDEATAERLLEAGGWEPVKAKRRTAAQIKADKAAAAEAAKNEE